MTQEKKSDTPEKLEVMLGKMSHEIITAIAVAIDSAITDAEKGKDTFKAIDDNNPDKDVEKLLMKGYYKAEVMVDEEFDSDEDIDTDETNTVAMVAGLAVAGEAYRQLTLAQGAETKQLLTEALHNPIIMTDLPQLKRFESPTHYYMRTVETAIQEVLDGTSTHEKAVKKAVRELTRSGVRYINYKSGWCNRTNVAVRRAVTTEITHDMAMRAFANARETGTDYYEVEYHAGARPSHAEWQGKVYTEKQLYEICGLGKVDGLCGANCMHYFYPFYPGTSERLYTDEFLEKALKESKIKTSYGGDEYTPYEARQKMRQMESAMRIQREKIDIQNKLNIDAKTDRAKYTAQRQQYDRFASAMGLKTDYRRVYQDGLGRV